MTDTREEKPPLSDPRRIETTHLVNARSYPRIDDETRARSDRRSRWVIVVVIIIGLLVVAGFVALHLTGAVGPGLHGGS